jgi:hypothetical protein
MKPAPQRQQHVALAQEIGFDDPAAGKAALALKGF